MLNPHSVIHVINNTEGESHLPWLKAASTVGMPSESTELVALGPLQSRQKWGPPRASPVILKWLSQTNGVNCPLGLLVSLHNPSQVTAPKTPP